MANISWKFDDNNDVSKKYKLENSVFTSNIRLKKRVLNEKVKLVEYSKTMSSSDSLVMESTSKCWFTKKELLIKDRNEKSAVSKLDNLSQFRESVSQSWSEFLYVWIQVESVKC